MGKKKRTKLTDEQLALLMDVVGDIVDTYGEEELTDTPLEKMLSLHTEIMKEGLMIEELNRNSRNSAELRELSDEILCFMYKTMTNKHDAFVEKIQSIDTKYQEILVRYKKIQRSIND